ncbi:MAG: phosphoribosyl-AMP cyclohydrolase [Nevskiales bacterium]
MKRPNDERWLDAVRWNEQGLVPAVAQEWSSGRVLTLAWMNRAALRATAESGMATYYSRSRQKLWRKGEESTHVQRVREIRLDCDSDSVVLQVEQAGGIACHTGRHSCFYQVLTHQGWQAGEPVLKAPAEIYK